MESLIIIPARGGSKGIPDKNIKELGGKPLIHYTIEAALDIFSKDQIIVSTDSEKIKEIAEETGIKVPFLRPASLSVDTSSSYDVIIHAMDYAMAQGIKFDNVILLQPTSPFRTSNHIQEALELYSADIDMVVSVQASKENPYYSLFEESEEGFLTQSKKGNFTRRQDCPDVYSYNGAIYIINPVSIRKMALNKLQRIKKYVMNSTESVDLDTPLDWSIAELILQQK